MITIYCAGYTLFPGDAAQLSGCCTTLFFKDKSGSRQRTLTYGLGKSDLPTAQLQAIRLGLMAIKRAFRQDVLVCITERDLTRIIDVELPDSKLILDIKNWIEYFESVEFGIVDSSDAYMAEAINLAGIAADSQKYTDSGSVVM